MPPTSTFQPEIPDAFAARAALGRGVNMGNMLEAPREGEWGVYIQEKYFDAINAAGFDSVRIPIRWNAHAAAAAPYSVDASFFARVDQVVAWALARGLTVIVDFHHYEEMMSNPNGHRERYLAIWRQVAEHYKDYPATVLFELLNEPNSAQDVSTWNSLLPQALAVVRESNPIRNVIIGPTQWNSASMIETLQLPADDTRIIATFHFYEPFEFTHQGAEWMDGADAWLGTTWDATDSQENDITRQFDRVAAWARTNNRPILLGEFGAYSKGDPASRVRWTSFVAREAEKRDFAWAYWEFCAGFGVYDPNTDTWREDLLNALIP
ncbi:MAG TPA: glycoside hydrolase family 5 protein [Anaerolineales bacterium]|jgi:endoglucanase